MNFVMQTLHDPASAKIQVIRENRNTEQPNHCKIQQADSVCVHRTQTRIKIALTSKQTIYTRARLATPTAAVERLFTAVQ